MYISVFLAKGMAEASEIYGLGDIYYQKNSAISNTDVIGDKNIAVLSMFSLICVCY
jgi:hypothetical protein